MFQDLPALVNAAIFIAAGVVVWIAGGRLAVHADAVADKTGWNRGFLGLLLLGGITSLPEISVATTATLQGTPALSVTEVLGSAAINVVILAIADATLRGALSSMIRSARVMLQGVLGIIVLAMVIAPSLTGDRLFFGIGGWTWAIIVSFVAALWLLARSQAGESWEAARKRPRGKAPEEETGERSLSRLFGGIAVTALAILASGFLLAKTADALAGQSGLGESFFGAVFLGFATSLPEVSTVLAAVRLRQFEMAIGDVFGTNIFNVLVIALVDALHPGGPILAEIGRFASFGAMLALVLTGIFLAGMLERRDRQVLRMGVDSVAVVLLYAGGVAVLYTLR